MQSRFLFFLDWAGVDEGTEEVSAPYQEKK